MVTWCIPRIYNPNRGQRTFAVHTTRGKGEGHMHCKRPKAEVLGSYIRGIHQVTMIYVIYTLIARYNDTIFYEVVYVRYTTCASIGQWPPLVYMCIYTLSEHLAASVLVPDEDLCSQKMELLKFIAYILLHTYYIRCSTSHLIHVQFVCFRVRVTIPPVSHRLWSTCTYVQC